MSKEIAISKEKAELRAEIRLLQLHKLDLEEQIRRLQTLKLEIRESLNRILEVIDLAK